MFVYASVAEPQHFDAGPVKKKNDFAQVSASVKKKIGAHYSGVC
jgi:hypothetical protein